MKKCVSLLLSIVFVFSLVVNASAVNIATEPLTMVTRIGIGIQDETAEPFVNTPCTGGNGRCQMKSSGWGSLWDVDKEEYIFKWKCCWQCKNCMTVLITEGDPLLGQIIGRYAFWPTFEPVNSNGCILNVNEDMVHYSNSTRMEGYDFTYF